jgi:hypothetical protein
MHRSNPLFTSRDTPQGSIAGMLYWPLLEIPSEFDGATLHVIGIDDIVNSVKDSVLGYAIVMPKCASDLAFLTAITISDWWVEAETNAYGVRYLWDDLSKCAYFPQFDLRLDSCVAESLATFEFTDAPFFTYYQYNEHIISDYNGRELRVPSFSQAPITAESRAWHLVQLENSTHTVACTPTGEPVVEWRIPVKVRFLRGNTSYNDQSPLEYRWFVNVSWFRATGITVNNTHFLLSSDDTGMPQMINFANLSNPIRLYPADLSESDEWVATLRSYSLAEIPLIAQYSWPTTGIYMRTLGGFNVGPFPLVGGEPQIEYIKYGDFVGWKTTKGFEFARVVDRELEDVTPFEQQALEGIVRARG